MPELRDFSFGSMCERMGLVRREMVDACLLVQSAEKRAGVERRPLGEIMLERGILSRTQVEEVLAAQRRAAGSRYLGPFYLVKKLGEGGMGTVFKAQVRATGKDVAIKVLPKNRCENLEFLRRFQREAKAGMELSHPNIVRIFTFGEDSGIHYMSMELVLGGDVKKVLKDRGKLKERGALKIVQAVARALIHANERGMIHRDIKPSNIMFSLDGVVKLGDFGLVKTLMKETLQLTKTGIAVGTPNYASPEQARGLPDVDIRSDIFSLGATLYHMVTGIKPFTGQNALEVMTKVVKGQRLPASKLNPNLGANCAQLIETMMATAREDRFQSPEELLAAIEELLKKNPGSN